MLISLSPFGGSETGLKFAQAVGSSQARFKPSGARLPGALGPSFPLVSGWLASGGGLWPVLSTLPLCPQAPLWPSTALLSWPVSVILLLPGGGK